MDETTDILPEIHMHEIPREPQRALRITGLGSVPLECAEPTGKDAELLREPTYEELSTALETVESLMDSYRAELDREPTKEEEIRQMNGSLSRFLIGMSGSLSVFITLVPTKEGGGGETALELATITAFGLLQAWVVMSGRKRTREDISRLYEKNDRTRRWWEHEHSRALVLSRMLGRAATN